MVDEVNTRAVVLETLSSMGLSENDIPNRTMQNLMEIENAVRTQENARNEALKTLQDNKLSVVSVAKMTGIARSTFYSNTTLLNYLNVRQAVIVSDDQRDELAKLKEELEKARQTIKKMMARDGQLEFLKVKVADLEDELKTVRKNANAEAVKEAIGDSDVANKITVIRGTKRS
ncbi:MAG: hypothetical protein IKL97_07380 [Eggerthellaceae bacterium]|nr:hypothetical protein [Eggerthellaceae bacterium]